MSHLLLAVDGSEQAQKAANRTLELAKALDAKVTIVSVAVPAPAPIHWSGTHFYYDQLLDKQKEQANKILEKAKEFFTGHSLEVDTVLRIGDPADEICQLCNTQNFSMVILGSRGLTGIKRVIIGSVANYVIQCSKIPVLVIK
ncbi:MAG: universal stress protein [Bacillota bacterium]